MNKSTNSESLINQEQLEKKNEIEDENKNETKIVLQDDTKNETQIETKEEIKMDEIKEDKLMDEMKEEIKMDEIKEDIKEDMKEDIKIDSKEESKEEIKNEIKNQPNYWRSEKGYKRKYQFREKRNYQVAEICVLLMLLNEHFQIELTQSSKRKTKVTNQIFYLKKMIQGKEIIDVEEIIRRRCKEKLEYDVKKGTDTQKAKRRLETYKINEMIHFMIDILSLYGYNFQSHYSTGVDGQLKNETIKRIWMKDFVMYNQFDIENIGMKIHDFMKKQIDKNENVFKPNEIKNVKSNV